MPNTNKMRDSLNYGKYEPIIILTGQHYNTNSMKRSDNMDLLVDQGTKPASGWR